MILTPGSFTVCILRIILSNTPRQTANVNLYLVTKVSFFLLLTVHYIYTNSSSTPDLSIRIVLDCFYLVLIFKLKNF